MHSNLAPIKITDKHLVTSADSDFKRRIKPGAFVNCLIQTASKHAHLLGWGIDVLNELNYDWVLSGLKFYIHEYPKLEEEIVVLSWPKQVNKLYYPRDFIVYNSNGKEIGKATSNWLIINRDSRRPKLLNQNESLLKRNEGINALNEELTNIPIKLNPESEFRDSVKYSDIDLNSHLTATRYIDFAIDTFSLEQLSSKLPKEIHVTYLREVSFGMDITIEKFSPSKDNYLFQMVSEPQKSICFQAAIKC